ncbi:ABC transporter ATP-binding protein [Pseudoroseomonas globiformis]|uniref:ABC transporter ATP-binding protein n=1 Tax=Teichococcus globiformis TaxID=2307229 RepID=A0ABV7G365_9PROT
MITFDKVSRRYGDRVAVDHVELEVPDGEICVLLGESGSGKSTLLRMVNRLVEPSSGLVLVQGQDARSVHPQQLRLKIGYVIQSVGLFPHWRVEDNVATVPRLLKWPPRKISERTDALLDLVGLPPKLFRTRFPHELSGGQAQRVGLARALAADPPLLLMDEPFSALDPATRRGLQTSLRQIHQETGKTILFVTHDVEEAIVLADKLAVLDDGKLVAQGRSRDLLRPDAPYPVRQLFGQEAIAFHRLATIPAQMLAEPGDYGMAPVLEPNASLKQALMMMLAQGAPAVKVAETASTPGGTVQWSSLLERL